MCVKRYHTALQLRLQAVVQARVGVDLNALCRGDWAFVEGADRWYVKLISVEPISEMERFNDNAERRDAVAGPQHQPHSLDGGRLSSSWLAINLRSWANGIECTTPDCNQFVLRWPASRRRYPVLPGRAV